MERIEAYDLFDFSFMEKEDFIMKKIILASASPRRRELLKQAGFSFEVMVSQTDEHITAETPEKMVEELSRRKARAVASALSTDSLVIGADTIVAVDGKILGKPADETDALHMLRELSGRTHQVYTGVTLLAAGQGNADREGDDHSDSASPYVCTFAECTDVTMYPMTDEEILAYIATGEPMDKAGAYGIQGRAAIFIKEIRGDYNNVVGLPIARLYQEVREWLRDK